LRDEIAQLVNCNWILSYDDVKQSRELYATFPGFYVATPTYLTAESGRRRQATELIVTNVPRLAVLTDLGLRMPRRRATSKFELKLSPAAYLEGLQTG
jgi:hypothetical protein